MRFHSRFAVIPLVAVLAGLLRDSLGFRGTAITDALTMEGIGKGYTTEQSSVLAVKAGADILLKPSDPTKAIDAVVAAVERGEISRARIDTAARHMLELKVRSGVAFAPMVSLERLRDIVGSPEHRAVTADIAKRAVTLLRDRDSLVPLSGDTGRVLVIQYAPETEVKAGRTFNAEMRAGLRRANVGRSRRAAVQIVRIMPNASGDQLASIARTAASASAVIVTAYVRRVEGQGRFAIPQPIAAWIDTLAQRQHTIVVTFGNPYLIQQFPNVGTYMATYGVGDDPERAPVSLPGFFRPGAGVQRAASVR